MRGDDRGAWQQRAQHRRGHLLVLGTRPGMQEAHGDRFHPGGCQLPRDRLDLAGGQRLGLLPPVARPLCHLEAQVPGHERDRLAVGEVVQVGPVRPADLEHVAEAAGGHERGHRAGPLGHGVDDDGGAVNERRDAGGRHSRPAKRGEHPLL
jgi:hypothetical protein